MQSPLGKQFSFCRRRQRLHLLGTSKRCGPDYRVHSSRTPYIDLRYAQSFGVSLVQLAGPHQLYWFIGDHRAIGIQHY